MAPYDSDSSDDEDAGPQNYTETNVLLGYADPEDQDADDDAPENKETVSRLGGRPDWIAVGQAPPSAGLARCLVCKALLVLLLQLNGELPERFPGHERRLYVLACRNKACRRKPGSVRVIRGVRVDPAAADAAAAEKEKAKEKEKKAEKTQTVGAAPGLGNSLFGVANPFSAGGSTNANPFSLGGSSSSSTGGPANPFSLGGASKTAAPAASKPEPSSEKSEKSQKTTEEEVKALPKTFAETLSINNEQAAAAPATPPEPWPPVDSWPAAYPVSWIADAEYETLDPTPAVIPGVVTEAMEVEGESSAGGSGGGGSGKEDKFVFESSMDAAFQKFADRVAQNPDQVIRYEFNGLPLLYNKDDSVAGIWAQSPASSGSINTALASTSGRLPPCPNCRSRRVFEVQLMPHAIDLLEADELGLEGMDWGTVLVAVCEKDCQAKGTKTGEASYLEEWAGVQWEDLQAQRR